MKNFLMQQRGRTCLNIVWIIVNVLLYTGTSVLLTFTTDAVFSKNLLALVEWSVVNLLVWMTFLVSNYFQTVFQEKLTRKHRGERDQKVLCVDFQRGYRPLCDPGTCRLPLAVPACHLRASHLDVKRTFVFRKIDDHCYKTVVRW